MKIKFELISLKILLHLRINNMNPFQLMYTFFKYFRGDRGNY